MPELNESEETTPAGSSSVRHKNSRTSRRDRNKHDNANKFKGTTSEMHGNVFQNHNECKKKNQFKLTCEALGQYINQTLDCPGDMLSVYTTLQEPILTAPVALSSQDAADELKKTLWIESVKTYHKRSTILKDNVRHVWSVIWGQCSPSLRAKVKQLEEYESRALKCDCAWLLREIKNIMFRFEEKKNMYLMVCESRASLHYERQDKHETNSDYFDKFKATVEAFEHHCGPVGQETFLIQNLKNEFSKDPGNGDPGNIPTGQDADEVREWYEKQMAYGKKLAKVSRDRMVAMMFLKGADRTRYGSLWFNLQNMYSREINHYPKDLPSAYTLLCNHRQEYRPPKRGGDVNPEPNPGNESIAPETGLGFLQVQAVPGTDGVLHDRITCFKCNKKGHYASMCPSADEDVNALQINVEDEYDLGFLQVSNDAMYNFVQAAKIYRGIPHSWILLDSQSTTSIFKTRSMLKNIRKCSGQPLRMNTNGGQLICDMVGDIPNFGTVWFCENSLANILSMAAVRKVCRVTMDTAVEACMNVHRKDGSIMKFTEYRSGLYYYDVPKTNTNNNTNENVDLYSYCFVETVDNNKKLFTRKEVERAEQAVRLYAKLGRPGQDVFESILSKGLIKNCPITADDAKRAIVIYGQDLYSLKGKMVKSASRALPAFVPISIPKYILQHHKHVTLSADFFYAQGMPFLHTIAKKIRLLTGTQTSNRSKKVMLSELFRVFQIYESRGFKIANLHADAEFECIRNEILPIELTTTAADEHVGDVERSIRTIKEALRCIIHSLPYKKYTKLMINKLITYVLRNRNQLPARNGISDCLSPLSMVMGYPMPDYNRMQLEFGTYVQAYECRRFTNRTDSRSTGAIALSMSPGANGTYEFMSVHTGKIIRRKHFTILPISPEVIHQVTKLATDEKQPLIVGGCPLLEWRPTIPITETPTPEDRSDTIANHHTDDHNDDEYNDIQPDNNPNNDINPTETNQGDTSDTESENDDNNSHSSSDDEDDDDDGRDLNLEERVDDDDNENLDVENEDTSDKKITQQNSVVEVESDDTEIEDNTDMTDEEYEQAETMENRSVENRSVKNKSAENMNIVENRSVESIPNNDVDHENEETDIQPRYNLRSNRGVPGLRIEHGMAQPKNSQSYDDHNFVQVECASDLSDSDHTKARYYDENFLQTAADKADIDTKDFLDFACQYVFVQLSSNDAGRKYDPMGLKKGIKMFGEKAIKCMMSEFLKFENLDVYEAMMANELTPEQRRRALRAINIIKLKRTGELRGRTVADGRSQHGHYSKEDTSSPTPSNDSLMLSLLIDAMEKRIVGCGDIPSAYIQANMKDFVVIKYEGESVDILCETDEKYKKFVTLEKGKKVIYLRLKKALYGCVQSGLLWYELFTSVLEKNGFKINPYEPCIANKIINDKQCTVVWYVDDIKVSHEDENVVRYILKKIDERFPGLTSKVGREHKYLGMNIKFMSDKNLSIDMKDYVKETIITSGMDVSRKASTPAAKNLFEIKRDSSLLDQNRKKTFHHCVAKLLYVSKRCRLDIQLAISHLTSRVINPTEDDWNKLRRVLRYLNGTLDRKLIIGASDISLMNVFVDASYAIHDDMKSHTGGCIIFCRGALMSKSIKQRLNTKSSCEAELVGTSDYIPSAIYARLFLMAQGYEIKPSVLHQDNESAIKLEKNGKSSSGQKTRHVDIRHFFVTDRIKKKEFVVKYCPTEVMAADFFTKPLQGNLFKKLSALVMGEISLNEFMISYPPPSQERVENVTIIESHGSETQNSHDKDE